MLSHPLAKPVFFLACLAPFVWIVWNALFGDLGANPVETITHQTGDWALRLLLITLLLTPLKNWSANPQWIRFRRMAGLFVYFYALCHFLIWFVADHALDVLTMWEDVRKRPYITLGFIAFIMLTPLAVTSNRWMMRKLGRHWKSLHRLVYLILGLVIAHYLWLVKADYREPLIYAFFAALLLLLRLPVIRQNLVQKLRAS